MPVSVTLHYIAMEMEMEMGCGELCCGVLCWVSKNLVELDSIRKVFRMNKEVL